MRKAIVLILIIILSLAALRVDFLTNPPVWPDEALYADMARNILVGKLPSTLLWQHLIPGVENAALWYPPVFIYLIAGAFRIFGFSIIIQREISVGAAVGLAVIFYFLVNRLNPNSKRKFYWVPALVAFLLIFDGNFLAAGRLSRPEIFVLLFLFSGIFLFLKTDDRKDEKLIVLFFSGVCFSLAFLCHFLAIIYWPLIPLQIYFGDSKHRLRKLIIFVTGIVGPLLFWLFLLWPNRSVFYQQMLIVFGSRQKIPFSFWDFLFIAVDWPNRLLGLSYILTGILYIFSFLKNRWRHQIWLLGALVLSWFGYIIGKMTWYVVYLVPFVYLCLGVLIREEFTRKKKWTVGLISCLLLVLLLINGLKFIRAVKSSQREPDESYFQFANTIKKLIPDGKTTYLSVIPDPYFVLVSPGRKLYEFPAAPADRNNFLQVLDTSDYIVINDQLESIYFGDLLNRYIYNNARSIIYVKSDIYTQAAVIELVPPSMRK